MVLTSPTSLHGYFITWHCSACFGLEKVLFRSRWSLVLTSTTSLHRYFISFLLDSTAGLLVIYLGLKLTQILAHRSACKSLYFGEYGE